MTAAQTVNQAVATRDSSPAGLITQYKADFAQVLPSHVKPDTWTRLALGALRRDAKLAEAAGNNPAALLGALLTSARLGLEPGTEQYYLTPRKVKGRLEVLGITGYQGHIELMYRAGAVSSVVAEVVKTKDSFTYRPGRDDVPQHDIDWDADDRGDLRLVYAYARMKDGATSKVIVLNKADIAKIKKYSQGADGEYSPWVNHPEAMWLKSAVRLLQKWVPTSAEYRQTMQQAAAAAEATPIPAAPQPEEAYAGADPDEIVEAELVHDESVEQLWLAVGKASPIDDPKALERDFLEVEKVLPEDATPAQLRHYLARISA
ncbi:MAG: recombinase RecT [Chloroflexi bacterium]|nr:recombinase RecT [Chloroflexota bacterium]